ncbi:MAG: hypothetical protein GWN58_13690 [Anaerolineae bacterium]|nr:hypothetical protein [Anaerolineae bacterium]
MAYPNTGFDASYGDTPWEDFDKNQRTVYVPELLEAFRHSSLFYGLVTYGVNLLGQRTGKMVFTQVLDPEPNIATLDNRAIWLPQLYLDSRQLEITCARYGDKVMLNKYDDMITYWRENGQPGLRRIISSRLAPHMVESLDLLARNAFLNKVITMFAGDASGFSNIQSTDTFDLSICRAVHLGADFEPDPVINPIVGIASPSSVYTVKDADSGEFISRLKYTDTRRMLNYEVGEYEGVRFSQHPIVTLWNVGEVLQQTTISASVALGDGAPDPETTKVEGVWQVGQAGATHYVSVADETGFEAGDYVTLHIYRGGDASSYDTALDAKLKTTNAALFNDPTAVVREVHSTASGQLVFTEPITTDSFQTDLGGGVYGYVTKGRPVHATVFLKGPRGVVSGVLQPPQTYTPPPVDDTESIYRFSWDAYLKYQQMYPRRFEVYFHAGPIRKLGQVVNL